MIDILYVLYIDRERKGEGPSAPYFCADGKNQTQTKGIGQKSKGIVTL